MTQLGRHSWVDTVGSTQLGRHSWVGARVVSQVLASCGTGCLRILTDVFAPCDPIHTGPFGSGRIYIVSRRRTRAAFRVPRNRRDDACRPVGVGVSLRYYYRGTRFRGTTQWQWPMRGTRFPYEPTCELQIEVQRLGYSIYEPTIRIPGRAVAGSSAANGGSGHRPLSGGHRPPDTASEARGGRLPGRR